MSNANGQDALAALTASPVTVETPLGRLQLAPLTLADWATVVSEHRRRFVAARAAAIGALAEAIGPREAARMGDETAAEAGRLHLGSPELYDSHETIIDVLWLALRALQPQVTRDQVFRLMQVPGARDSLLAGIAALNRVPGQEPSDPKAPALATAP